MRLLSGTPIGNSALDIYAQMKLLDDKFWIRHGIACRKIGAEIGRQLGSTTVTNVWIPDGYKDVPIDRAAPRDPWGDGRAR